MGRVLKKKKTLSEVLQSVDPNLNVVSPHKKRSRTTEDDWGRLAGVTCTTCGKDILKTYGPLKECHKCFYKRKDILLEKIVCPKCSEMVTKVTTLSDGLQDEKIVCPKCGTFSILSKKDTR